MNRLLFSLIIMLSAMATLSAQDDFMDNQDNYQYKINKTNKQIVLDGIPNEEAWHSLDSVTTLWQKRPILKADADGETTIKMTYNDEFLYVAAVMIEKDENVVHTLKRDLEIFTSDGFGVILDPANQKTNGVMFGVNAYGAQNESLISDNDFNSDWNNKWYSETFRGNGMWSVEMAIPFKSLRYKKGDTKWGLNFVRNIVNQNEIHIWTPIPDQFLGFDLGYVGLLEWDEAPPAIKRNVTVIPYASVNYTKDSENDENTGSDLNAGLDAKVAITSSLNLDLTVNADFSQVEVDEQVSNLSRFSIFFPEKRNFFLENSDIFSGFGIPPIRPFFSRRIGLDEESKPVPILFGARLSGNVNNNLRIGLLNVHTAENEVQSAQNYSSAAFSQRIFKRSSISGLITNRQAFTGSSPESDDYGRNAGINFTWSSEDGKWQSWQQYYHSFKPNIKEKAGFLGLGGGYFGQRFQGFIDFDNVGTNFYTDMGFMARINNYDAERDTVIRLGFNQLYSELSYAFYPEKLEKLDKYEIRTEHYLVFNPDGSYNEQSHNLRHEFRFRNRSNLVFSTGATGLNLQYPIDFTGETPIPKGIYNNAGASIFYESDSRKSFSFSLGGGYRGFYNGKLVNYTASVFYRYQPWFNISLKYERNNLDFPAPHGSARLNLFNSRIEVNLSKSLFWTTFLQYNAQSEDFGVNSRIQWRFAPLSDVYLVYTDNYLAPLEQQMGISHKNRAFVLKFSYWWNV